MDRRSSKTYLFLLFIALFGLGGQAPDLWAAQAETTPPTKSAYAVNANDILLIKVLKPDEFESELTVSPSGDITFPYVGNIDVKGITLMEVQEKVTQGLSEYMKYPVVSVSLKESRSRLFYVYGEVNKPGSYPIQENMTVIQAISMAEGFTRVASMEAKVLRTKKDGSGTDTLTVNMNAVMEGKSRDITVEPGDVITATKSFF